MDPRPLLEVRGLRIVSHADGPERIIVSGLDLTLSENETVGIVGESGSGKSLSVRAINGLLPAGIHASGSVRYRGQEILGSPERSLRRLRGGEIAMVLQDPFTMLNPLQTAGRHIEETLRDQNGRRLPRKARRAEIVRRLAEVGIRDPNTADRYPFELSGGLRQRVAIASALTGDPRLLIADEPSTALDANIQRKILELLRGVQESRGMGMILITHDLGVAFEFCDRIVVLYAGEILEVARAELMRREPLHPYTLGLLLSQPSAEAAQSRLVTMRGSLPGADRLENGCVFAPRCDWAAEECTQRRPDLIEIADERQTACARLPKIRAELTASRFQTERSPLVRNVDDGRLGTIVRVTNIKKTFGQRGPAVQALAGVSIEVGANESVGVVGESGSGKTTLTRCILGLEMPTSGTLEIADKKIEWSKLSWADRRAVRQHVQVVFQDPYSSLNPVHTIRSTLQEAIDARRSSVPKRSVSELLSLVGLPDRYADRKPVALSGGERQRVAIARALAVEPQLIILDEPVSALDVSVQAQILNLFAELRKQIGMSYLFITHDLAVVRHSVDRIYVMHEGKVIESGPIDEILDNPQVPYTQSLVRSARHNFEDSSLF
jgi:peptide/nickel transport system ATP-binding protein